MDLLYSTGNYSQYLIIIYNGKESEKEYMCVCVYTHTHTDICITESLYCTPEMNTTL